MPGASLHVEVRGSGPALLMIPGGNTDAGIFDGVAGALADRYTVIAYDPRGNSRSLIEGPPADQHIEEHAEDARRLLEGFSDPPAFVFGSSSGAQVALELLARHPEHVVTAVAHEPPAFELLPDAAQYRALFDDVIDLYHREGAGVAMKRFAVEAGIEDTGRSRDTKMKMALRADEMRSRMSHNRRFFFQHQLAQFARFVPDVEALDAVKGQLVLGVGRDSLDRFPSKPAAFLAERLGIGVAEFPGCHLGYTTHPAEFAARLARLL